MKRTDALSALPCAPAGFRLMEAAAYVGVSVTHFLKAREQGIMPAPVDLMGAKVYRRAELDEALAILPRDQPSSDGDVDTPWQGKAL